MHNSINLTRGLCCLILFTLCQIPSFGQIADQELETVVVVGKHLQNNSNGYTLPVKGTGLEKTNNAQEMLSFLPHVSMKGEQILLLEKTPTIYVNGIKITSQDELNAIQPQRIVKIEVDYLSIGEGATAKGGTIRITTKRELNGGFSGRVKEEVREMTQYGHVYDAPQIVFDASLGKWTFNYYANYIHKKNVSDETNSFCYDNGKQISSEEKTRSWAKQFSNRLNVSYEINRKMTVALSEYLGNYDIHNKKRSVVTRLLGEDESGEKEEDYIHGPEHKFTQQTVGKYIWETDDNGSSFEMTADYLAQDYYLKQKEESALQVPFEQSNKESTHMLRLAPSYHKRFDNGARIEAGVNYQYIHYTDASSDLSNIMNGYAPSAFINYSGRFHNFMYSAGLTVQHNKMIVYTDDVRTARNDMYYCPQANLMWVIAPQQGTRLSVMYQRSVEDMPYSVINRYKNYSSPNQYTTGNPSLITPSDHQAMAELTLNRHWSWMWMYERIVNPIYYSHGTEPGNGVTWAKPENGDYEQLVATHLEWSDDLTKWWKVKVNATAKQIRLSTTEELSTGSVGGSFGWNNIFNFSPSWGATLNGYWETGIKLENYSWRPVGNLSASIWKALCKERFRISVQSTICAKGRYSTTFGDGYNSVYHNATKPTSFSFSFIWNFKNGQKVNKRVKAESIQDYHQIQEKR